MKHPTAGSGRRLIAPAAAVSRRRFLEVAGQAGTASAAFLVASAAWRAQAAGEPLKIGCMGPFTGPASRTGDEIKNGVALALEDASAAGDCRSDRRQEARRRDRLRRQPVEPREGGQGRHRRDHPRGREVHANGWHSSVAMAVMDAEAPYKIVHVGDLGESQFISEKIDKDPAKYRGWFKGWPAPPVFAGLYGPPLKHFIERGAVEAGQHEGGGPGRGHRLRPRLGRGRDREPEQGGLRGRCPTTSPRSRRPSSRRC